LDGATRFNAIAQLGCPHIAVQLVDPDDDFTLHTWYHAISTDHPAAELYAQFGSIAGVTLERLETEQWHRVFDDPTVMCYFIARDGSATVAHVDEAARKLPAMNELVAAYTEWGHVERTLLTDLTRLLGQFPNMAAVAVFPQFQPTDVFDVARHGQLLPAGLTRFVIPGRVLHLNYDLERLATDEPLSTKRAWLNKSLAARLARSGIRYYQEPVILMDD
jgi:hypothetical protein